ncbi:hypothetical protein [Streptomyces sp. NPDC001450]
MQVFRSLRSFIAVAALGPALAVFPAWSATPAAGATSRSAPATRSPDSGPAVHHDTSPTLRSLWEASQNQPAAPYTARPRPKLRPPRTQPPGLALDPVVQNRQGTRPRIPLRNNFEGIPGQGPTPPDPNSSVGSRQIVEAVNTRLAVYSKTGATVLGPLPTNTLWSGFGGLCQTTNSGDAVVRWDTLARRWIISQLAFNQSQTSFRLCVAVSSGEDATGSYHRYDFAYQHLPDYPKVGVWPDAYYVGINNADLGVAEVCAWDRQRMLRGASADQQCYNVPTPSHSNFAGFLLPSDLDGRNAPPRGTPNTLVTLGATDDTLQYWRFHVDWANQANTTVTGPGTLSVAPYTRACENTDPERCVPQADTAQKLDSISYWPMYRLAYRNLGNGRQSLVFNHAVDANGGVGTRWYELRLRNGVPVVHQQSTYAPDATYRWMGSVAQDRDGDIALGYSQSSAVDHPSIRVTARLADDPRNRLTFHETTVRNGAASQTGSNRWGDYTSTAIDPSDDCTFWYTNQYQQTAGHGNWRTRLASFRLPGCGDHH